VGKCRRRGVTTPRRRGRGEKLPFCLPTGPPSPPLRGIVPPLCSHVCSSRGEGIFLPVFPQLESTQGAPVGGPLARTLEQISGRNRLMWRGPKGFLIGATDGPTCWHRNAHPVWWFWGHYQPLRCRGRGYWNHRPLSPLVGCLSPRTEVLYSVCHADKLLVTIPWGQRLSSDALIAEKPSFTPISAVGSVYTGYTPMARTSRVCTSFEVSRSLREPLCCAFEHRSCRVMCPPTGRHYC
jgi:hypothetical protein